MLERDGPQDVPSSPAQESTVSNDAVFTVFPRNIGKLFLVNTVRIVEANAAARVSDISIASFT